jgi:hypothetical protein
MLIVLLRAQQYAYVMNLLESHFAAFSAALYKINAARYEAFE